MTEETPPLDGSKLALKSNGDMDIAEDKSDPVWTSPTVAIEVDDDKEKTEKKSGKASAQQPETETHEKCKGFLGKLFRKLQS